jgi:hypothetical protein
MASRGCALPALLALLGLGVTAEAFSLAPGHSPLLFVQRRAMSCRSGARAVRLQGDVDAASSHRRALVQASVLSALSVFVPAVEAAPFGLGDAMGGTGWGEAQKAGVKWGGGFSNPLSGGGDNFQAELVNGKGNPLIVGFKKPKGWKVSTNTGIAVQNYVTAESAYVLVAPAQTDDVEEVAPQYVLDKVTLGPAAL